MARDSQFQQLLTEHASMIARIASSYERRPALAQELVQDTSLALWRAWPGFRGDSSPRTFIARIAHNVCVSHVRKESRGLHRALAEELPAPGPEPDEQLEQAVRRDWLLSAVQDLPLSLKPVVTLHLEGFSNIEIAQSLKLTANNVGVRLNRGKALLKSALETHV